MILNMLAFRINSESRLHGFHKVPPRRKLHLKKCYCLLLALASKSGGSDGNWFQSEMLKSDQKACSYAEALGRTGARLCWISLNSWSTQFACAIGDEGGAFWMSGAPPHTHTPCLCHNLICIHFLDWDEKSPLVVQANEAEKIRRRARVTQDVIPSDLPSRGKKNHTTSLFYLKFK